MKRVLLSDLQDVSALSWVLDQALFLLANSSSSFRGADLCRIVNLRPAELTRMKLAHSNPHYQQVVCRRLVYNLLRYLFEHFPGLVVWRLRDGRLIARLVKKTAGKKTTNPAFKNLPKISLPKRMAPKPGSTRWFLIQISQN